MYEYVKLDDNGNAIPLISQIALLETDGYFPLKTHSKPMSPYDMKPGKPILVAGKWERSWEPVDTPEVVVAQRTEGRARVLRGYRDIAVQQIAWKIERYARESRLGKTPTDDIDALDAYVQALADVPQQLGFPWEVVWPTEP